MTERDFVGYGPNPPRVEWPDGARIAVSVVVNYEEGSEYSLLDGDAHGESHNEVPSPAPSDQRDLANESFFEYGSRAGVWRLLDILGEYHVKADSLVTRAFRVGSAAWGRLGEGFGLFRSGVVLWPMRSLWCAIPRQGRHQRARNGSCSLMQRWERWPGQPVGPTSRPTVPGPFA